MYSPMEQSWLWLRVKLRVSPSLARVYGDVHQKYCMVITKLSPWP